MITAALENFDAFGEVNDLVPSGDAVVRILAAVVLGAMIGLERELDDQPGLRTHITVARGAALFGVVSTLGFREFVTDQRAVNVQFDVTRVASQVVVGIGFLGAGMIFRSGSKIRNLTTAASLWVTSAIGLACGVGDLGIAAIAAVAVVVALFLLRFPRDLLRLRFTRRTVLAGIRLTDMGGADAVLRAVEQLDGVSIRRVGWSKAGGDPVLDLTLQGDADVRPETMLRPIVERPEVVEVRTDVGLWNQIADAED